MAIAKNGDVGSMRADTVTSVMQESHSWAKDFGPAWGLAVIIVLFLFLPKYGVIISLANMYKEDRADDRKRKVESERLISRYNTRKKPEPKKGEPRG